MAPGRVRQRRAAIRRRDRHAPDAALHLRGPGLLLPRAALDAATGQARLSGVRALALPVAARQRRAGPALCGAVAVHAARVRGDGAAHRGRPSDARLRQQLSRLAARGHRLFVRRHGRDADQLERLARLSPPARGGAGLSPRAAGLSARRRAGRVRGRLRPNGMRGRAAHRLRSAGSAGPTPGTPGPRPAGGAAGRAAAPAVRAALG